MTLSLMLHENTLLNNRQIRVSIDNVTRWQRSMLERQFDVDGRFSVIEPIQSNTRDTNIVADDVQLRLIGFNSSCAGDDEVFVELLKNSPNLPTIALMATAQKYVACELPNQIKNRVLMPLDSGAESLSVPLFYVALFNAIEYSLPILCADNCNSVDISKSNQSIDLLVIGASTGGPTALQVLLKSLPQNLHAPIVIVQHMPSKFTSTLARQLNKISALDVTEAKHQDILKSGHVYIAPGNRHTKLRRINAQEVRVEINDQDPVNFCRPSVDVLFESAALAYGSKCIGVVLTGMGIDGLAGSTALSKRGARIVVQDESSSVVWGMPGSIASAGLANEVVHIDELGPRLTSMLLSGRAA